MKISHLLCCFLISYLSVAQRTEAYYDFDWKPCTSATATYYSTVQKTDSGWLRNNYYAILKRYQMRALFEDEACEVYNGKAVYFYANGVPSSIGRYLHGKREGVCVSYFPNRMLSDSGMFHNGNVVDKRFGWHRNGFMSDSINRISDSTYVEIGWFDDGDLAFAGHLVNDKQEGKWKYYHHNGEVSAQEMYVHGKMTAATYFDENGIPLTDTTGVNRQANFNGGETGWLRYLEKKLYWPPDLHFTASGSITVGISFAIDENGKVVDAEVSIPFYKAFDNIALDIIKKSPAWAPAMSHNRKVKAYRRQPIVFEQTDL